MNIKREKITDLLINKWREIRCGGGDQNKSPKSELRTQSEIRPINNYIVVPLYERNWSNPRIKTLLIEDFFHKSPPNFTFFTINFYCLPSESNLQTAMNHIHTSTWLSFYGRRIRWSFAARVIIYSTFHSFIHNSHTSDALISAQSIDIDLFATENDPPTEWNSLTLNASVSLCLTANTQPHIRQTI